MRSSPGSPAVEPDLVTSSGLVGLRRRLGELDRVVVAFSGGRTQLSWRRSPLTSSELTGSSASPRSRPSLAPEELADVRALAFEWSLRHSEVETDELANPAYAANDGSRSRDCKDALLDVVGPLAESKGAVVVLGVNTDDLGDHRPGKRSHRTEERYFHWWTRASPRPR